MTYISVFSTLSWIQIGCVVCIWMGPEQQHVRIRCILRAPGGKIKSKGFHYDIPYIPLCCCGFKWCNYIVEYLTMFEVFCNI